MNAPSARGVYMMYMTRKPEWIENRPMGLLRMGFAVLAAFAGAAHADEFTEFFETFAEKRDAIDILSARFEQKTISPDDIVTSFGTITYVSPRRLIFSYDGEEGDGVSQVFVIDDDRYYQYDAETLQLQIFDIDDRPEVEAFFLPFENDTARLRDAYTVRLLEGLESDDGVPRVYLAPNPTENGDVAFEAVTISLGEQDFLPTDILIMNDEESSVRIAVREYALNADTGEHAGRIHVPANVDVIENDTYVTTTNEAGMWIPRAMADRPGRVDSEPLDAPRSDDESGTP